MAGRRADFFELMDAANIDLKAFSEDFYWRQTGAHLNAVLDTLVWLVHESQTWLEITTLLIPGLNDSDAELRTLTKWITAELGVDVPLHLTAFHPANRMTDRPSTPLSTLHRARKIAQEAGLHYVYTGNLSDPPGSTTACPACHQTLITRVGYTIKANYLTPAAICPACQISIPGRWS